MNVFKNIFCLIVIFIIILSSKEINNTEFPTYRVILDPGHGGGSRGREKHGDRFDTITGKYLSNFDSGVRYKNLEEQEIGYSISLRVIKILRLTLSGGNFAEFKKILKRFTDENPGRIIIESQLSRGDSKIKTSDKDPNAPYRLYDYPDESGKIVPGRISKINFFRPHLVISLHCDYRPPQHFIGINPVITAPYSILEGGLRHLRGEPGARAFFYKSLYTDWFIEKTNRSDFQWFINDSSLYFTGHTLDTAGNIGKTSFQGYRYNMVSWKYSDLPGWELLAAGRPEGTRYSINHNTLVLQGRFWDRERSQYEKYRRDAGEEGFGGDNLYASREIIRYILLSLDLKKVRHTTQKLGNPYVSVWSVPLLVNAVSAFIELGYIYQNHDRYILTKKQDEVAEGIAAGIYSLLAGLKPRETGFRYKPKGKRVDLGKYLITSEKSYFDDVVP